MHIFIMRDTWHGGLACIQSFGRRGHQLTLGCEYMTSVNSQSDFVSRKLPALKKGGPQQRAKELCDLMDRYDFDLVVPIADEDTETVAHAREMRPECHAFVGPSVEAVERARDRNAVAAICLEHGIPAPVSIPVDVETARAAAEDIGFPCYLKFSQTHGGIGVLRLESMHDLEGQMEAIRAAGEAQLQEDVVGMSLGVTGFAVEGRLVNAFGLQTEYRFSKEGTPPYVWRHDDPRLVACITKIAEVLNWTGALNVGFLENARGDYLMTEINPRLGGSTNCAMACGWDLPSEYLRYVGAEVEGPIFPKSDTEMFIVLGKESAWRRRPGGVRLGQTLRQQYRYVENDFPDDRGYNAALKRQIAKQKKTEWMDRLLANTLRPYFAITGQPSPKV